MINPYANKPLRINVLNVAELKITQTIYGMGNVSKNIANAVYTNSNPEIEKYYGSHKIFDDNVSARTNHSSLSKIKLADDHTRAVTRVTFYPSDNFMDVKKKISIITGIPVYRQHICFTINRGNAQRIMTTYDFYLRGINMPIVISELFQRVTHEILGIPIDKTTSEQKENTQIKAFDTFRKLELFDGYYVDDLFVVDLNSIIGTLRHNTQTLNDAFQLNVIYYGFVVKYFPMLSIDLFKMLVTNEPEIALNYPSLSPDAIELKECFASEQKITDLTYLHSKQIDEIAKNEKISVSVTNATLNINPVDLGENIVLRNLFDLLQTTIDMPAVSVFFNSSQDPTNDVYAIKRHLTSYDGRILHELHPFITASQDDLNVSIALLIPRDSQFMSAVCYHLIILTIYSNSFYTLSGSWDDDEKISLSDMNRILTQYACPVIEKINRMGGRVFGTGAQLRLPDTKSLYTKIKSINVSVFWERYVSANNFKEIKKNLRQYENAGLIKIKPLQSPGAMTILFIKGMTNYNTSAFERLYARLRKYQDLPNQYAYLIDESIHYFWSHIFAGRTIHLEHKSSSVKIEIINADMSEFSIIYYYLTVFLENSMQDIAADNKPETSKTTWKLIDQDPKLFDLKKYDPDAIGYTTRCQGNKQPVMYYEEDIPNLTPKVQKNLVKFWNFTNQKHVFYHCANKPNIYLGFQVGIHPLGYCLPCCQKKEDEPTSKRGIVNKICSDEYVYSAEKVTGDRYTYLYGKAIPIGRTSHIPSIIETDLFSEINTPFEYRLYGVNQNIPSVKNAGYLFAMCFIVQLSVDAFITRVSEWMLDAKFAKLFYYLGSGHTHHFKSAAEFVSALQDTFVNPNTVFTQFTIGSALEIEWRTILINFIAMQTNIFIATFREQLDGQFDLILPDTVCENIHSPKIKLAFIFETKQGVYPMIAIHKKRFHSTPTKENIGIIFKTDTELGRRVLGTIRSIITNSNISTDALTIEIIQKKILIPQLMRFNAQIKYKLTNKNRMCYGIVINVGDNNAYFPIVPHAVFPDNILECTRLRDEFIPNHKILIDIIHGMNFYLTSRKLETIKVSHYLIRHDQIVGFIHQGDIDLYFYHKPINSSEAYNILFEDAAIDLSSSSTPRVYMPYVITDISEAISRGGRTDIKLPKDKQMLAFAGKYRNYLYQLLCVEFVSRIRKMKNDTMRAKINAIIRTVSFDNLGQKQKEIVQCVADYPGDVKTIEYIFAPLYDPNIADQELLTQTLLSTVEQIIFEFDRKIIFGLHKSHDLEFVRNEVKKVLDDAVHFSTNEEIDVDNLYTTCDEQEGVKHCSDNKKLIIDEKKYDQYVDVLVSDILNPLSVDVLMSKVAGVIDEFDFVERTDERIEIDL